MTGLAAWQRVVYYLGMALILGGVVWALYQMFIVRACPMGQFNHLTLIAAGMGCTLLALQPFSQHSATAATPPAPAPAYLAPVLRRNPRLAVTVWTAAIIGVALAAYAQWSKWPSVVCVVALIPSAYYVWFGIEVGQPAATTSSVGSTAVSTSRADRCVGQTSGSAGFQPADKDDRQDACPTGPRAAGLAEAALVRPSAAGEKKGRTSAAPTAECGQGRPPSGDEEPRDA